MGYQIKNHDYLTDNWGKVVIGCKSSRFRSYHLIVVISSLEQISFLFQHVLLPFWQFIECFLRHSKYILEVFIWQIGLTKKFVPRRKVLLISMQSINLNTIYLFCSIIRLVSVLVWSFKEFQYQLSLESSLFIYFFNFLSAFPMAV